MGHRLGLLADRVQINDEPSKAPSYRPQVQERASARSSDKSHGRGALALSRFPARLPAGWDSGAVLASSDAACGGRFFSHGNHPPHGVKGERYRSSALAAIAVLPTPMGDTTPSALVAIGAALYVAIVFRLVGFLGGLVWLALLLGFASEWLGKLSDQGILVALFGVPLAFGVVRWRAHRLRHQPAPERRPRKRLLERLRTPWRRTTRKEPNSGWKQRLVRLELALEALASKGSSQLEAPPTANRSADADGADRRTSTEQGTSTVAGPLPSKANVGPDTPPLSKETLIWDSK